MSEVRLAVEKGEYAQGVQLFRGLISPTPVDLTWAGACLIYERRFTEAELRLRQAVRLGEKTAWVFLAALSFMQGRHQEALETLLNLDPTELNDHDAARWYRERTRFGWMAGEPKAQLKTWANRAWELVLEAPLRQQVATAMTVGDLYNFCDEPRAALAYLDFAVENGKTIDQEYAQLCRVNALIGLERYDDAHTALDQLKTPALLLQRDLKRVEVWQAEQKWDKAIHLLKQRLPDCRELPVQEVKARILLLTELVAAGDDRAIQEQQERLEGLIASTVDQAALDHRFGIWLCARGKEPGLARLRRARQVYLEAQQYDRVIAVSLALAEFQPLQRNAALSDAVHFFKSLPSPPNLNGEWRFIPNVFKTLLALPEEAIERRLLAGTPLPPPVKLLSLGQVGLYSDGQQVSLRLTRAAEILCYLLWREEATMGQIQQDLFLDVPKTRAKNYFHQVRVEVAARVPGLSIRFDVQRKVYFVSSPTQFEWDVQHLKKTFGVGKLPPEELSSVEFLPGVEDDWAVGERGALSRWVTQVGLETMETWYQAGEYQKCIFLAERLLPLDPLDEGLHTFLLNATFQIKGHYVAVLQYRESAAAFIREVGEVPEFLQQLQEQWRSLN